MNTVIQAMVAHRRELFNKERELYRALNKGEIVRPHDAIIDDDAGKFIALPDCFWGKPVLRVDQIAIYRKKIKDEKSA